MESSSAHGNNEVVDDGQHNADEAEYDEYGVGIDGVVLIHSQVSEVHLCHVEAWIQLQTPLKVEGCFFVLLLCLVHLTEGEVLKPGVVVGRLHVEGALG